MPYKHHDAHRHKFEKARYRVTNWPDYDRGLVQRGDVRFWIEESVLEAWSAPLRKTPGGQAIFSNLAIETTLMLGALYRLPLRQNEGFVRSLLSLIGVDLAVPDHTTLSRRRRTVEVDCRRSRREGMVDIVLDSTGLKFYGPGEWARKKHGETRRAWRKLHVAVDPAKCEIVAHELTDDDTSDPAMVGPLVKNAGGRVRKVFAPSQQCSASPAGQWTVPMTGAQPMKLYVRHGRQSRHPRSSFRRVRLPSVRRAHLTAAVSENVMRRRLPAMAV